MKKDRKGWFTVTVVALGVLCLFVDFGLRFIGSENFSYVTAWWCSLLLIGLAFLPLAMILFSRFHDAGYIFGKTLGIAIAGWIMWVLSSLHWMKFSRTNCILILVICFFANCTAAVLYWKKKPKTKTSPGELLRNKYPAIIVSEVIFFGALVIWCYLKGINPEAYGTERMMDYSYLLSIFKTDYMPPNDVWYAGQPINYYYFGHYLAAFLTKVSDVPVSHAYNIAMMTLAALGFALCYSIGNNLMRLFIANRQESHVEETDGLWENYRGTDSCVPEHSFCWIAVIAGFLSAAAVTIAGNMHYPLYRNILPKLRKMNHIPAVKPYVYSNSTRFIGYMPDVPDKTIHEFPVYSYIVGDLHAHVLNTVLVMTVLGLMLAWLMERKAKMDAVRIYGYPLKDDSVGTRQSRLREIFHPNLVVSAFLVGMFYMVNAWDFPIYIVVCGAMILFSNLVVYRYRKEAWILTAGEAALFGATMLLVTLPFRLKFQSISTEVKLCGDQHTALTQLLVLWGLPVCCVLVFLVICLYEYRQRRKFHPAPSSACDTSLPITKNPVAAFLDGLDISELFVLVIGLCAIGLLILPEIVYVKDIYGEDFKRANTMFKLTYQSFIMFGIAMAYIITRCVTMTRERVVKTFGLVMLILLLSTLPYFNNAVKNGFGSHNYYSGLDGTEFIGQHNKADQEAIAFINENIPDNSVILENYGNAYTFYTRISTFTGHPTVLGWTGHEWLWRCKGDRQCPKDISVRQQDINTIYTSTDIGEVCRLIQKYDIEYIYVGDIERTDVNNQNRSTLRRQTEYDPETYEWYGTDNAFRPVNDTLLQELGEIVFWYDAEQKKQPEETDQTQQKNQAPKDSRMNDILYPTYLIKLDLAKINEYAAK